MIGIVTIVCFALLNVLLLVLQRRKHRKIIDALRKRYEHQYCWYLECNAQLLWRISWMEKQYKIQCPERFLSIEEIQNKRVEQANE